MIFIFKKVLASILLGVALAVLSPIAYSPVAEAGIISVDCGGAQWEVTIDDESVLMIGKNHAHVSIQRYCLDMGHPLAPQVADVMWGAGYVCNDLNTGKPIGPANVALAIANYMSANY